MAATTICAGYTGLLYIGEQGKDPNPAGPVLMTKYSLGMNTGLIKNEAIGYRTRAIDQGTVSYMLPGVMGPAEFSLSVSADISMDLEKRESRLIGSVIPYLIGTGCRKAHSIRLTDSNMDIDWNGSYYLKSIGMNVSEGGSATMDMQAAQFGGKVTTSVGSYTKDAFTAQDGESGSIATQFAGDTLVGYWAMSCRYDWMGKKKWYENAVLDLSMNFSQNAEPVYTCDGSSDSFSPLPSYIMFGMPSKAFECTLLMHNIGQERGMYDDDYAEAFTDASQVIGKSGEAIIYFWGKEAFRFNAVLEDLSVDYSRDRPSFHISASAT